LKITVQLLTIGPGAIGTLVAKEESDKKGIKSNRVKLKIAVSGGFGGGVLSRYKKRVLALSGEQS
jgi:hypothetical protein